MTILSSGGRRVKTAGLVALRKQVADTNGTFSLRFTSPRLVSVQRFWPYIDKRYAGILRQKRDIFRRMTGTRKNLYITMVTTHGVADNAYAKELVASSVEAEALLVNAR